MAWTVFKGFRKWQVCSGMVTSDHAKSFNTGQARAFPDQGRSARAAPTNGLQLWFTRKMTSKLLHALGR